jgi:hypothetical protein
MADEKPEQIKPEEESKKDTVRINLPPGLAGRGAPPSVKPAAPKSPAGPPPSAEDEAKKETAVMGKPAVTPKPKSDTSRVQVSSAKPTIPETPRPTVKLRREEPAAPAPAAAMAPQPVHAPAAAAAPSGADVGLSLAAMVLSVAVLVYLALQAWS